MEHKFTLKNLHCSNCATKIERALNKQKYIKSATINVATSKLKITLADGIDMSSKLQDIVSLIQSVESDVSIVDSKNKKPTSSCGCGQCHHDYHSEHNHDDTFKVNKEHKFTLNNLHCSNCAAKIERALNKQSYIKNATINVATSKLKITLADGYDISSELQNIISLIQSVESDVSIAEGDKAQKVTSSCGCNHDHNHSHNHECVCGLDHAHTHDDHNRSDSHGHGHDHDHDHSHDDKLDKKTIASLIIGSIFFAIGLLFNLDKNIKLIIFSIGYLVFGYNVLIDAVKGLFKGRIVDEGLLMSIASLSAFFIGEYPEALAVMLFYKIGQIMESKAVNHSRNSISSLIDMKPEYANLKTTNGTIKVDPESVNVGNLLIVKSGERVPLDSVVVEGKTTFDTSAITGESVPKSITTGESVYSGFINKGNVITVKVTKKYEDSTIARILDLVENSADKKADTEKFMTKFARYYTPSVVIVAFLIAVVPSLLFGKSFSTWLYRGALFLVVSCPCALVVSIPLGYFAGIGKASSVGVLIKGGNFLEALANLNSIVFDKTGTLTKGNFIVSSVVPENNLDKYSLLYYGAYVQAYSNHPIAKSIKKAYDKDIDESIIKDYKEKAGHGVEAIVNNKLVTAGNERFMKTKNIKINRIDAYGTIVYMAVDDVYQGYIVITDEIKRDSKEAIDSLQKLNIKNITMLTGDNKYTADKVASMLNIQDVHSNLLPQDKVSIFENILDKNTNNKSVGFVGDGINDAPVLARADIGFSMGGLGSDAAIEASDVVLMTDELSKIPRAITIARKTRAIIWQNIIFALGIKLIVMILGVIGLANMWEAVFADVGVTILAILNSLRILNKNY
ncbi:heavy metal translocating P-type ATPase [Clostridiaceae bacterium M8S5]|nr:heavy metal translocating P-type ATPase [Clostridiaceae bacterium M8S5]